MPELTPNDGQRVRAQACQLIRAATSIYDKAKHTDAPRRLVIQIVRYFVTVDYRLTFSAVCEQAKILIRWPSGRKSRHAQDAQSRKRVIVSILTFMHERVSVREALDHLKSSGLRLATAFEIAALASSHRRAMEDELANGPLATLDLDEDGAVKNAVLLTRGQNDAFVFDVVNLPLPTAPDEPLLPELSLVAISRASDPADAA